VFAGLPDPALTRAELEEEADVEADTLSAVVKALWAWQEEAGITTEAYQGSDLLESLQAHPDRFGELRRALVNLSPSPGDALPSAKHVGRHLREAKNRNFGGFILRSQQRHNANLYMVERLVRETVVASDLEPGG
jgi:hypothetical protein